MSRIARNLAPDIALDWLRLIQRYKEVHGEFPRILRPRTYNEKILHRNLVDRRRIFTQVADKYAVRSYVEQRLGAQVLSALYHITEDPRTIPFSNLPQMFVVKPTHGSGWVEIVRDKAKCDPEAIIEKCEGWLKRDYYRESREIPYRGIRPRIMVEEFIDDGHVTPHDYKFYVFDGRVELILVIADRFGDKRVGILKRGGAPLGAAWKGLKSFSEEIPAPPQINNLIVAAEKLGKDFDFIRADFYANTERIWFGELTATPGGGMDLLDREEYNLYLGSLWKPWRRLLFI